MPKVSFITASYNYAHYIEETIESVEKQTFSDWEMLIIDDGSKDNSVEIINKYVQKDSRVKLLTHLNNENKGLIETLKLGLSQAQGEYIVFLESDDYIREDYLEKKLNIFEQYNDVGLIYNSIEMFNAKPLKKAIRLQKTIDNYWTKNDYPHNICQYLTLQNYIPTFSCVMVKKTILASVSWECFQPAWIDWWLWIQISQETNIYYINEKLTYWRIHKDSYINRSKMNVEKNFKFLKATYGILPKFSSKKIIIMFYIKRMLRIIKYAVLLLLKKVCLY